ncbi:MAG: DUF1353 domain-containing protein [Gammaproteobacteria bacterium]|nr:DUF1353 domain-containing protein [Gammaproteobacteria bacterium]
MTQLVLAMMRPHRWRVVVPFEMAGIFVSAGFVSDGASVPRWLWWFEPPAGSKAFAAAIVHDFAMRKRKMSPKDAAAVFDKALTIADVKPIKRRLMVLAVRYLYRFGRVN